MTPKAKPFVGGRGPACPKWKGGTSTRSKFGYVRITAGPDRGKLEHRLVIEKLLGGPIPAWQTVHHVNGNRRDNRPENLLLVDRVIHESFNGYRGRVARRMEWY